MKFHFEKSVSYGVATHAGIGIRRIMAKNPGPFTYHGTGTYIIGKGEVAVIDPGPDIPSHVNSLLDALDGEKVSHILVTHTHRDHSPAANALKLATGAETYGFGPHSRNKGPSVEEGADYDFIPDIATIDGDIIEGRDFCFEAIHTPGHTSNHLCFSLKKHGVLFPGDHVMGWSTTVVSPPDGNMALYRSSLQRLLERDEKIYLPTHGPAILNPYEYVKSRSSFSLNPI